MSITHKRFPTVGGNGKIIEPVSPNGTPRTFPSVKSTSTTPAAPVVTKTFASAPNVPPFDLDGTEGVTPVSKAKVKAPEALTGFTTIPMLRRPSKSVPVAEKPKAKAKVTKPVTPLAKAKDPTEPVAKPALAKRNAKVVPEVTSPILATKAEAKKIADVKKSVGPKAAKVIDAAVKEASAKPGKIADKKAHDKALKAGTLVKVEPKAKVTKKVTPIKPAKTVAAPKAKVAKAKPAKK